MTCCHMAKDCGCPSDGTIPLSEALAAVGRGEYVEYESSECDAGWHKLMLQCRCMDGDKTVTVSKTTCRHAWPTTNAADWQQPPTRLAATTRERIVAGPKFVAQEDVDDETDATCSTCGDISSRDAKTGLCRPCWRAWRWSAIRECDLP